MTGESPFDREAPGPESGRRSKQDPDAILGELVSMDPGAFLSLIGAPSTGRIEVVKAGVFPHVIPIDVVLRDRRGSGDEPWLAVVELVACRDPDVVPRLELTTIHCAYRLGVPIAPIVVLLRPEADDGDLTGQKVVTAPWGDIISQFSYEVVRAWQEEPSCRLGRPRTGTFEGLLASDLRDLIRELREGAAARAGSHESEPVTCLVLSLPDDSRVPKRLLGEIADLEEATPCVYLMTDRSDTGRIVSRDEGCAVMRWKLFQQGTPRFGPPDERLATIVGRITSPQRLTELDHLLARSESRHYPISTWNDLLAWLEPGSSAGPRAPA